MEMAMATRIGTETAITTALGRHLESLTRPRITRPIFHQVPATGVAREHLLPTAGLGRVVAPPLEIPRLSPELGPELGPERRPQARSPVTDFPRPTGMGWGQVRGLHTGVVPLGAMGGAAAGEATTWMEARPQAPCPNSWAASLVMLGTLSCACLLANLLLAVVVFLLVLVALLLYKYRYKRHVQAFLGKFGPSWISPSTKWAAKRSSIGAGLLFANGCHADRLMNEKWSSNLPTQVTYPDPAATRPESIESLSSFHITALGNRKRSSRDGLFYFSPLSMGFPQTPPPTVPRRSQESLESVSITSSDVLMSPFLQTVHDRSGRESLISIASSGIFSPSLLSWPAPPSAAPGIGASPPPTSGPQTDLSELAARYKSLTPTKLCTRPLTPVGPSTTELREMGVGTEGGKPRNIFVLG